MTPIEMAEAMEGRARVRRKITNREDLGDRLSDQLEQAATMLRQQQAEIDQFKAYQKHDIELAEAVGWEKGYELGRQRGMQQERALWELATSTQEIEK